MKRKVDQDGTINYGKFSYTKNNFDPKVFLGKTTVIAGISGSGKSFVLNSIIAAIAPHIRSLSIYSGSAETDKFFPMKNYTDPRLIKTTLDIEALQTCIDTASELMGKYREIMNPIYLERASKKLILQYKPYFNTEWANIQCGAQAITKIKDEFRHLPDPSKDDIEAYKDKLVAKYKTILALMKKCLTKYKIEPKDQSLVLVLSCVTFNPDIAIVINDLTDEYDALSKAQKGVVNGILNKGRHSGITFIILIHTWNAFGTTIRNSTPVIIFTGSELLISYVNLQKIRGAESKLFHSANDAIIVQDRALPKEERQYSCVLYLRNEHTFQYIQADKKGKQVYAGKKYFD